MKRNSLILIFFAAFLLFFGFDLAIAQDRGTPDTCIVQTIQSVPANTQVTCSVYVYNDESMGAFTIPLTFPDTLSSLDVVCDSVSFVGTRGASATLRTDAGSIDNAKHRINLYAVWFVGDLAPGSGSVATIYFHTGASWDPGLRVQIDTTEWPTSGGGFLPMAFVNPAGDTSWVPVFHKGALDVKEVNTPTKPTVFSLAQNYPNPFNPKTMIRFALPKDSWVKLEVYNILGQKVKTLVDEKLAAGVKEVEWDGRDGKGLEVASGIYFYKIKADDFSDVKKMVMLK